MRHLFWCLILGTFVPTALLTAQTDGQLVVFVQEGRSISMDFIHNSLPDVEELSKRQNISLKIVDASKGAPKEVKLTPSIFYNSGGTYLPFEGRYGDMDALEEFVQSDGQASAQKTPELEDAMVWNYGRSTLAGYVRIDPLDAKGFEEKKAMEALMDDLMYFQAAEDATIPEVSRSFYLDLQPEKSREGDMLIHLKLYSAFDLENPVFVSDNLPSGSEWKEWQFAFEKAGKRLEAILLAQISSNENGDGFEPVKNNVPVRNWNSLTGAELLPNDNGEEGQAKGLAGRKE